MSDLPLHLVVALAGLAAGAAFGALAQPTTLTDLDPQVTPPCEVEE